MYWGKDDEELPVREIPGLFYPKGSAPMTTILTQDQMNVLRDIALELRNELVDGGCVQEEEAQVAGIVEKLRKAVEPQIVEIRKLKLERRGFQVMARRMPSYAFMIGPLTAKMEAGLYIRAAGDAECVVCHLPYVEHPEIPKYPTFHLLCDHTIVKT